MNTNTVCLKNLCIDRPFELMKVEVGNVANDFNNSLTNWGFNFGAIHYYYMNVSWIEELIEHADLAKRIYS